MIHAAAVLLALGYCEHRPCVAHDVDEAALMVVQACGEGPRRHPEGAECVRLVSVVWWLEARLALYPPHRYGDGCGPGQVLARSRWGNTRVGYGPTPTCPRLRVPAVGLRWAVYSLRAKASGLNRRSWLRSYNGNPARRDGYARTGERLLRRLRRSGL